MESYQGVRTILQRAREYPSEPILGPQAYQFRP